MRLEMGLYVGGRVNVAVAVADESRDCIGEVAAACRAVGFLHASTLDHVGVFTGSAPLEALAELRGVPGVIAVEVERPTRIRAWLPAARV